MKVHWADEHVGIRGKFVSRPYAESLDDFLAQGVRTLVSVRPQFDEISTDDLLKREMQYYWIPMSDGKTVDGRKLSDATRAVLDGVRDGKVIIFCNAGRNRSALVAASYLCARYGYIGIDAVTKVREARPRALANQAFVDYLGGLQ